MANKMINVLMSLQDRFSGPMRNINNLTREQEKQLKRAENALTNYGKNGAKALGNVAKWAGAALAGGLTAIAGYSTKVGSDFEAAMSKVQAISGASGSSLDALTAKAKEMGATTQFSASEAAEAMQYMAMAGWKDADMLSGIKGIMDLAAASGESLGSTSDIVTDALTAFGLTASDSGRFADILAAASSNANTNVSLMGATFKYVAPLAGSLKYSVDDVAVAIGLMANAGIKGEQAGTALRSTFTRMIDPPKEAAAALDALGINVKNADGTVKPLNKTMVELRKAFSGLSESQKAEYASSIAGKEAMSGFLAIVNASDTDFEKLTNSIKNADGTAADMAKTMNNNLKGQLKQFGSVTEGIGINIYDKFKAPLTDAFKGVNDALGKLNQSIANGELTSSFDKMGDALGKVVTGIADGLIAALPVAIDLFTWVINNGDLIISLLAGIGAGFAYFKIATLISSVTTALSGATTAMAALNAVMAANPIGMVAIAVGAVVAGAVMLWKNWDKVKVVLSEVWESFKRFGNWLEDKFMSIISPIVDKVRAIADGFKSFGNKIFGGGDTGEKHNALGTSYFSGGRTFVNEGNRGELINLPSGAQIVPHDIAVKAAGNKPPITINLTVQGNVIGNEEFINECGNRISERVVMALGNM